MNPWALLGIVLAVGALTGGAYVRGRSDGENAEIAGRQRVEDVRAAATEAAASAAAAAISKIEVRHVQIRQQLETTVREVPVYRACRHDPAGLQRLNAALAEPGAEPAAGGELPAASAAGR